MPLLYLQEAEPFLELNQTVKMEENINTYARRKRKKKQTISKERTQRLTKRSTSMIATDATIVIIEVLQILALIQSMSLRWSWPKTWIKYAHFIFVFNLDIWDFYKVQSEAYTQLQSVETSSSSMSISYNYVILAWGSFIVTAVAIFTTIILVLHKRQPPYLMVHKAKIERVILILIQVLALPLGTVLFRLFHCTPIDHMAVFDDVSCFEGLHWAYCIPAVLLIILMFVVVPGWMIFRIRSQKLTSTSKHHESYMKLKEVEYMAGLDVVWEVQGFSMFSSFHLRAIFYRPVVMIAKLIILIVFSAAYSSIEDQSSAMAAILGIYGLLIIILRPFRVSSFNVAIVLLLNCLCGDATLGAMIAATTPADVENPWLVEPYSYYILIGINAIMVLVMISWVFYMMLRKYCCNFCYPNDPMWPIMMSYGYKVDGTETYKFMAAVLRGRAVVGNFFIIISKYELHVYK